MRKIVDPNEQLQDLIECKGKDIDLVKYINKLRQIKENIENNQDFIKVFEVSKALAEKNRLLIFQMIFNNGEMCICEFQAALGLKQPTISHHLRILEQINFIEGIKKGKFIHYRLKKSIVEEYPKLLEKIMNLKTE